MTPRPIGTITRGTTNPNRLRRVDRWSISTADGSPATLLRTTTDPLVIDLGYGASPVTTLEFADRLARCRPDVQVVGVEIDPARVAAARAFAGDRPGVHFLRGGFELGDLGGRRPVLVRAANVWRQYPEAEVTHGWATVCSRLAPGGLLIDLTCDEIGRRTTWVAVRDGRPVSLTLSMRLAGLARPSDLAERLPKVLIHRNLAPEPVHRWLQALDEAWAAAAPLASFGARQRFLRTCQTVRDAGWPVLDGPRRWRLGEVGLAWSALEG